MSLFLKDPAATLDYALDWGGGYLAGRTLVTSDWRIEPAEAGGLTLAAASVAGDRSVATVSAGVPGHIYRLINQVRLSDGLSERRSVAVRVGDC